MRSEVSPEPLLLGRARAHGDVAVERHDVPRAEIVAVVSLGGIARRGAEVAEVVGGGRARVILVVAERGGGADLVPAPARVVAVLVVRERAARVDIVAEGEHGARSRVEDGGRGLIAAGAARGDGPGPDERRGRRRCGHGDRLRSQARRAVSVGHGHPYRVGAGGLVGVRRRNGHSLASGGTRGLRRTVALVDNYGPEIIIRGRSVDAWAEVMLDSVAVCLI